MKKILLMLFMSILFSCSEDIFPIEENLEAEIAQHTKSETESTFKESKFGEPMVLGEKIRNPYSVKSLQKQRSAVVPTHYYVRFLPENNQEYGTLLKNVRCFPFPLDRKIIEGGSFYRDPDPANVGKRFSWQYAVVAVDKELPDVYYEVLDEICMPDDPSEVNTKGIPGPQGPELHKVVVRVWDNLLNRYIPLQGLAVNVINTAIGASLTYGITDETGTAIIPKYFSVTKDIFYNIFWNDGKASKWFLTDGNNNQLFYNVKAVAGVTNIDIKSSDSNVVVEQLLGTIHRAVYRTYHKANSNLIGPIHEDFIQIAYLDESHPDYAGLYSSYPPYSSYANIKIYGRLSNGRLKGTRPIFSTIAHELGHLIHDVNSGRRTEVLISTEDIIIESWGRLVEKFLTDREYALYGHSFYTTESLPYEGGLPGPIGGEESYKDFIVPNNFNFQNWPFDWGHSEEGEAFFTRLPYSPIFIDLMDDENQRDYYRGLEIKNNYNCYSQDYPNDNVKNFTIGELQNLLKTTTTIEQLRDNVKSLSNLHGNSSFSINNLFVKYIEYWRKHNPTTKGDGGCTPENGGCVIYD